MPGTAGSIVTSNVDSSIGRSKSMTNAVSTSTSSPTESVGRIRALVGSRVRKAARCAAGSGRPDASSAPASTVTVWYVPGAQAVFGRIVRTVDVASHDSATGVAGSTWSEAATLSRSICTGKLIVTGDAGEAPVRISVANSSGDSASYVVSGFAAVRPAPN